MNANFGLLPEAPERMELISTPEHAVGSLWDFPPNPNLNLSDATGVLVFIFAWNEFLYALTLTSSTAARTVPVGIALFPGLHEVPWGEIAAGSVAVTLPVVALAIVFQRRVLEGLTAGAVKG